MMSSGMITYLIFQPIFNSKFIINLHNHLRIVAKVANELNLWLLVKQCQFTKNMQKIGMKRLLVNELLNKVCKYLWGDKSQDGQVYL